MRYNFDKTLVPGGTGRTPKTNLSPALALEEEGISVEAVKALAASHLLHPNPE